MNLRSPQRGHDVRSLHERAERKLYRARKKVRKRFRQALPRTHVFFAGMQNPQHILSALLPMPIYRGMISVADRRRG